jgi:hypothetical protein
LQQLSELQRLKDLSQLDSQPLTRVESFEAQLAQLVEGEREMALQMPAAGPSAGPPEQVPEASMTPEPANSHPPGSTSVNKEALSPELRGMYSTTKVQYTKIDLVTIDSIFKMQRIIINRMAQDQDHTDPALAFAFYNLMDVVCCK